VGLAGMRRLYFPGKPVYQWTFSEAQHIIPFIKFDRRESIRMAKKQTSFIVERNGRKDNTEELNSLLNNGWTVVMICPMSGNDGLLSHALVILEKEA
jgi:hypothetical protein